MRILVFIITFLVFSAGVFFNQKYLKKQGLSLQERPEVLSQKIESPQEEEEIPEQKPQNTPSSTKTPMIPTPTLTEKSSVTAISVFQYPDSEIVSSSENSLLLNTTDDSKTVADWYRKIITNTGMKVVTSEVAITGTNSFYRLVGSGEGRKVEVEIEEKGSQQFTEISVVF